MCIEREGCMYREISIICMYVYIYIYIYVYVSERDSVWPRELSELAEKVESRPPARMYVRTYACTYVCL